MHSRRVLAALAVLVPSLALADPLELSLKNQVPAGQRPSLTLSAQAPISSLRVELERAEDHRAFTLTQGKLAEGQSVTLTIGDGKAGHAHWKGKLTATLPDGNRFSSQLTFETAVGGGSGGLRASYDRDHLDLEKHVLELQLSKPAGRAELVVFGDDGSELGRGEATFHGEPPGTWLRIPWLETRAGNVLRLEVKAFSAAGEGLQLKLYPWSVRIAHEEVVFPTGQATIQPSEEPKLDASYQRIIDAVEKARKVEPSVKVHLYIAGHTDTVGAAADNRKLSLARARAIGAWFRDRGLPLPIAYAGFGEDALKVKTPDNTDEAANRRADYIVGIEEPQVARGVKATWYELR